MNNQNNNQLTEREIQLMRQRQELNRRSERIRRQRQQWEQMWLEVQRQNWIIRGRREK